MLKTRPWPIVRLALKPHRRDMCGITLKMAEPCNWCRRIFTARCDILAALPLSVTEVLIHDEDKTKEWETGFGRNDSGARNRSGLSAIRFVQGLSSSPRWSSTRDQYL